MAGVKELLALDIGGTSIRAALVRGTRVLERVECRTPRPAVPGAVLDAALELAAPFRDRLEAVGVACAGAVTAGWVTATAAHTFPEWTDIPVAGWLSQGLGVPAAALNDARAAAWGEAQAGAGRGVSEFMFVTVSTGLGAGLVLGGQLHLAGNGLDAELGFTSVPASWHEGFDVPGVGRLAALEFETSGTALNAQAARLGFVDARSLCDAAEAGGPQAEAEYRHSAALLAWKIADVAALLGVTRVALGGSVGLRPGYLRRVQTSLAAFPARYQPEVVHAELGADAGLVGAALWAGRAI